MRKKVMIIGGGASGLTAAIASARAGADVMVLEHMDRIGKKILSTGNGRCNLTNLTMDASCYRSDNPDFPMKILDRYSIWETLTLFEDLGIITKSKNGYIYPNSEQASAVLDTLRLETARLNVTVITNCNIQKLYKKDGSFFAETDQMNVQADAVILATGSKAAPHTGSDGSGYELAKRFGHHIIRPLPALVQLRCAEKHFRELAGIRCEARVTLAVGEQILAEDQGELQLTDYGLSGIPTMQVSRYAAVALAEGKRVTAYLDFLPSQSYEETEKFLSQRVEKMGCRTAGDLLIGVLNKKLVGLLLKLAKIPANCPVSEVEETAWSRLFALIKAFRANVTATNSFDQAQVCRGGVDTREVSPRTLESRIVSGLYLVGELLDVDGICGGYNLQWAWSTGMIAGAEAGRDCV